MKGVVFNVLNQMVEEKFGLQVWQELLDETNPPSGGSYTAVATYPDEELFNFVGAICKKTGNPPEAVVKAFGEYLLGALHKSYPVFFDGKDLFSFLKSIHDVVHVEVRKLYPDAGLPDFTYEDGANGELIMNYSSKRKLYALAEGLIEGSAKHFGESVKIQQEINDSGEIGNCKFTITKE